ncbi:MAG: 8-oxo-dGTP diphosphatase MutT [Sphingobacteriales bacterium]|nr:8-oxo-dGTP diphosphatase MutT [Sphingobacteriales bacterium]
MMDVSCAIIIEKELILATQRSITMPLPLKWEFPGGKVELNETPKEALIREIKEELDISIEITGDLAANTHTYGTKTIRLIPFTCFITQGSITLKEHAAYKWLKLNELLNLDWAEADIPIVNGLINSLSQE